MRSNSLEKAASVGLVSRGAAAVLRRLAYRLGLPRTGHWAELLNTDSEHYGGSNVGNLGGVDAVDEPWHGQPASAVVTLPPLAGLILRPEG